MLSPLAFIKYQVQELQKTIGDTLETGVNVARAVITAKAGAIKTASDVAPDVIEGTRSGTRFLGSVIRAANSTAPLILDVSIYSIFYVHVIDGFDDINVNFRAFKNSPIRFLW